RNVKAAIEADCEQLKVSTGGLHFWKESRRLEKLYASESQDPMPWYGWQQRSPYEAWIANHQLRPRLRTELLRLSARLLAADGPRFSLLVDTRDATIAQCERLARSLRDQLYAGWQLLFVIRADADPALTRAIQALQKVDARICFAHGRPDEHFAVSLNQAVGAANGNWLLFPSASARLAPEALVLIAESAAEPDCDVVVADEDHMDDSGGRHDPVFKVRWSPELILSGTYPG